MTIACPSTTCRFENAASAQSCERCSTPLAEYARLLAFPAQLFNLGLQAARDGNLTKARDLFSAVVCWCPFDIEAKNALALACFLLDDRGEAKRQWDRVIQASPNDVKATAGLLELDCVSRKKDANPQQSSRKRARGRRRRNR